MGVILETDRLFLKDYIFSDLDSVYMLRSNPLVWRYSSKSASNDIEESKCYLENIIKNYENSKLAFQALFLKYTNEYIGEAGILSINKHNNRAVIGYNLLPKYWGNGYASEITKELMKYLFENEKIERIEALTAEDNEASRKVLEKCGFIVEGLLRKFAFIDNQYVNVCYYAVIREDYDKLSSQ